MGRLVTFTLAGWLLALVLKSLVPRPLPSDPSPPAVRAGHLAHLELTQAHVWERLGNDAVGR